MDSVVRCERTLLIAIAQPNLQLFRTVVGDAHPTILYR